MTEQDEQNVGECFESGCTLSTTATSRKGSSKLICTEKDCEKEAILAYYCCRLDGGTYNQLHCFSCFCEKQSLTVEALKAMIDKKMKKVIFLCPQDGKEGKHEALFHSINMEDYQLEAAQAQMLNILEKVGILKTKEQLQALCLDLERKVGKNKPVEFTSELILHLQAGGTLMRVEGCQQMMAYLFCYKNVFAILNQKMEGSERSILQMLMMLLVTYTIEPWKLSLSNETLTKYEGDSLKVLKATFSAALCYASNNSIEARDVNWSLWLQEVLKKVQVATQP